MNWLQFQDIPQSLDGDILLPASKSLTNRVLILRALSSDSFEILNQSTADDSLLLSQILECRHQNVDIANAGTAMRFLTAYFSLQEGEWMLDGDERMKQRPVGDLVNALRQLGADIAYQNKNGFPPLKIRGKKLQGGKVIVQTDKSSQFVSALMLIAPFLKNGLEIQLKGDMVSSAYVDMTAGLLKFFDVSISQTDDVIQILPGFNPKTIRIENDWSAAAFFYGLLAVARKGKISFSGLTENSFQGDRMIASLMKYAGVETSFAENGVVLSCIDYSLNKVERDMKAWPDLVIPYTVSLTCLEIPFVLKGLVSLRYKESDRLTGLMTELIKLGAEAEIIGDVLRVFSFRKIQSSQIKLNTYNDHRMAMGFSIASLRYPQIWIENPECVSKSFPGFWQELEKLGFRLKIVKE